MRRFMGLVAVLLVFAFATPNVVAQSPSASPSPEGAPSPSSSPSPSPTASAAPVAFTPLTDTTDDLTLSGTLGMTLNQFTLAWNAEPGSTKLRGKWKLTPSSGGYKTAEHYWTGRDNRPYGLLGVVAPDGKLVSMASLYAPTPGLGSISGGLEALGEVLMMDTLVSAATGLPNEARNAVLSALDPYHLAPDDFLTVNKATTSGGFYFRMGQTPGGKASVLIARQANVPVPLVSPEPTPTPTLALPTVAPITPAPTPVPSGLATDIVTRSGYGSGESLKFALVGGDYEADWTATDDSDTSAGCYAGLNVENDDAAFYGTVASTSVHGTQRGTNYLNNVPEGSEFYIGATTSCSWTVTLTRLP
jgi:hypothetical protein